MLVAVAWMNLDSVNSRLNQIYNIAPTKLSATEAVSDHYFGLCQLAHLQLCLSRHFFYYSCLPATLPVGDDIGQSPTLREDTPARPRSTSSPISNYIQFSLLRFSPALITTTPFST